MKKILLFILLLFLPFIINASIELELNLTKESIHDDANVFKTEEIKKLNDQIKRFEINSGIKFYLITVKTQEEINSLTNSIYYSFKPHSFRKDDATLILIYHDNNNYNFIKFSNKKYNSWESDDLKKFSTHYLLPLEVKTLPEYKILENIENWTKFFQKNNTINLVIGSLITLFFTLIIIRKILLKYDFPKIVEVTEYINEDKIKVS